MAAHRDGDPSYGHCQNRGKVLHSFMYPKILVDFKVLVYVM